MTHVEAEHTRMTKDSEANRPCAPHLRDPRPARRMKIGASQSDWRDKAEPGLNRDRGTSRRESSAQYSAVGVYLDQDRRPSRPWMPRALALMASALNPPTSGSESSGTLISMRSSRAASDEGVQGRHR